MERFAGEIVEAVEAVKLEAMEEAVSGIAADAVIAAELREVGTGLRNSGEKIEALRHD